MSDHKLEIQNQGGELHLTLVCTAPRGAACKKRPAVPDSRDIWYPTDTDLVDTDDCWAVEWQSAVGFIDAILGEGESRTWASLPVTISYDEGVIVNPDQSRRGEIAWLLWCANSGYLLSEDREILTNWFLARPEEDDHPDDNRKGWLELADAVMATLAPEPADSPYPGSYPEMVMLLHERDRTIAALRADLESTESRTTGDQR